MAGPDDFHKRLERIQESHAGGKSVDRQIPGGVRGQKIGLVREHEEPQPNKVRSVISRLIIMLVIGVFGVRFALAALVDLSPEALDQRQAELWAEEDLGSKSQAVALMIMGVADPMLASVLPSPEKFRETLEETVIANLPELQDASSGIAGSETASTAQTEPVETDQLVITEMVIDAPLVEPESAPANVLSGLLAGLSTDTNTAVFDALPDGPPSGWQLVREDDILNGGAVYQTMRSAWTASKMPTAWEDVPFMGNLVSVVNQNQELYKSKTRFLHLYFNPQGKAVLVEYLVSETPISGADPDASAGDEIFVEKQSANFWFTSETISEPGQSQIFQTVLGERVLMAVRIDDSNPVELKELLDQLPLGRIANVQF